jgi:class 3 adenylate cyclase
LAPGAVRARIGVATGPVVVGLLTGAMAVAQVGNDFSDASRRDSLAVRVGGEGFACCRKILAGSVMPVCAA